MSEFKGIFHLCSKAIAAAAIYFASKQSQREARKEWERKWRKREVWGIWAAAAVGVAAIIFTALDSYQSHQAMHDQLQAMVAAQRPWIQATMSVASPLTFDDTGVHMTVRLVITNVGNTPATFVRFVAPLVAGSDLYENLMALKLADDNLTDPKRYSAFGVTLFPKQSLDLTYRADGSKAQILHALKNAKVPGYVTMTAALAVDYKFPGGVGRTSSLYMLFKAPPFDPASLGRFNALDRAGLGQTVNMNREWVSDIAN